MPVLENLLRLSRPFWPKVRPSVICIGGQKCGTSALYTYFKTHPEVALSETKELDFFCCDALYQRGKRFYHSYFPVRTAARLKMVGLDVTPGYLGGAKRAARRIYAYDPKIKLLVLLRNPVDRAFSAWKMYVKLCASDRYWFDSWMDRCAGQCEAPRFIPRRRFGEDFLSDVRDEIEALRRGDVLEMPIVQLSLYASYLRYFTDIFPESQILITRTERMREDPAAELNRICQFIGVSSFPKETVFNPHFEGGYSDECPADARQLLNSFFAEDQVALAGMLSAL